MQVDQPFLKEVRTVRYLAFILVILSIMDAGIITVQHWNQIDTIASIALLGMLGYNLFFLTLAWQLRKRHEWMRKTLWVLAYLGIFGLGGTIYQLALEGPIRGSVLYRVYYYGIRIIFALISAALASYLGRSSVRDACRGRQLEAAASHMPQHTLKEDAGGGRSQ